MQNNRKRVFAEAVSLDAWHDPFQVGTGGLAVYVELTFHQGRVGGDDSSLPFTFKVGLKRAVLTVHLEKPLNIDRKTIARSSPEAAVELSKVLAAKRSAEASVLAKGGISPASLFLALNGSAKATSEVSQEDQIKLVQTIPETLVIPKPIDSQAYAWSLEPSWSPVLNGQPWNPVDKPRFAIKPIGVLGGIAPSIRAELSCALEDISITDIKRKPINDLNRALDAVINPVNEAAAQQYLKIALRNSDLEPSEMDNRFSSLLLASVLAAEEG